MSKYQNLLGLISGICLLILPAFFPNHFSKENWIIYFYQILVLFGLIILGFYLSKLFKFKYRYWWLFLCITELTAYSFIIFVSKGLEIPGFLKARTQGFYNTHMLNIIQFDSNIGVYDEELFYRFRPGEHSYNNLEFDTHVSINSFGVRDDETSLNKPQIIFLGDSYTMGWGVEDEESFVSLLEKKTKKKALNAGVSSYGTAREYTLLKGIDFDSCQILAIQFCVNDIPENKSFVENNLSLQISPIDVYQLIQRANKKSKTYYPFKWSFEISAKISRAILHRINRSLSIEEQDPDYLNWLFEGYT